jgi:hypothetical protein
MAAVAPTGPIEINGERREHPPAAAAPNVVRDRIQPSMVTPPSGSGYRR